VEQLDIDSISPRAPEVHESKEVVFAARDLFCGYYGYNSNKEFTYSPEIEWPLAAGIAKFGRSQLLVSWETPHGKLKIEIAYKTIVNLLTCSRPPSITLTLWEPPRIYHAVESDSIGVVLSAFQQVQISELGGPKPPTKTRLTAIPHATQSHSDIIGQCLIYRISVHPKEFARKVERLRARDVLSISAYHFPPTPLYNPSFADGLRQFQKAMTNLVGKMPFEILYQLHGLVKNAYLLPWTAQTLLDRLHKKLGAGPEASSTPRPLLQPVLEANPHNQSQALGISGMAFKKLFTGIPFPAPDVNALEFDADEIVKYLEDTESEIQLGLTKDLISVSTHIDRLATLEPHDDEYSN
jgi:hypothetical protein